MASRIMSLFLLGVFAVCAHAASPRPSAVAGYGLLPPSFEQNRGQTDSRVQFLSRGAGYTLFLTSDGAVLSLNRGREARP